MNRRVAAGLGTVKRGGDRCYVNEAGAAFGPLQRGGEWLEINLGRVEFPTGTGSNLTPSGAHSPAHDQSIAGTTHVWLPVVHRSRLALVT